MHSNTLRFVSALLLLGSTLLDASCARAQWVASDTAQFARAVDAFTAKFATLRDYELHSTVSSYRNASDRIPEETGRSTVWKVGDRSKAEHLGVITYQDKTMRVMVDPEERMIYLTHPEPEGATMGMDLRAAMFRAATKVQMERSSAGIRYRLHFPKAAQYSTFEVSFDAKGWLRSIVTTWGQPIEVDPGNPMTDMVLPKVELKLDPPIAITGMVNVDMAQVIAKTASGTTGVGPYAGYEVFDMRAE